MALDIPGYTIKRTLGRGGMATVYLCIQEVFEREVALKVMSKVLAEDPNFGQRFFREAKIVSKLVHPNIVTVHDVGMHEGYCYLSMEYIDGRDLKHLARSLTLREKITAIRDISKALIYAGEKGYVHRDIKPENIMFHSSDGRAVLMDFGIARAAESDTQVTQAGTAIGTPHYMSPEQAKGKAVDNRSDIYSLGVVFYYILAGRVPFDAESAVAIGIKHITEPVPLLPNIFEGLQPIIDKMMAKDVAERYQNARELLEDIDALDIEMLEHSAEFAGGMRVSAGHTPLETLSRVDDSGMETFETGDHSLPSLETFKDYEVEKDSLAKDNSSMLPGFLAGTFVVAVVALFIYFKHPEWVQPWLEKVTALALDPVREAGEEVSSGTAKGSNDSRISEATAQPELGTGTVERQPADNRPVSPASPTTLSDIGVSEPANTAPPQTSPQQRYTAADLRQKIESLRAAYASDSIHLSDLVAAYRALLALDPTDTALKNEFDALRQEQTEDVLAFAKRNGSSPQLDKRISQFRVLFPEVGKSVIDDIQASAKIRKRVMSLVLEGEAYLRQNNLTKPQGRNALDAYDAALALDPDNQEAKQGRIKIAKKLSDLAVRRYENNELGAALASAKAALDIDPQNQDAKRIDAQASKVLEKAQRIETLLRDARQKLKRGDLFTPANASAFHDYQTVLLLQPENSDAKEGVDRVIDALSAKVWQLVGDEQFIQAKELMRVPEQELGTNPRIQSLSLALDEVIGDKISNTDPRIDSILIDNRPIANFDSAFRDAINADRSLFLGFSYANFQSSTTVLQAVLMDGARSVQIAQVPVVVEGARGKSTFRIDRPVEGFPSGSYAIEMRLGPQTLNSTLFKVE